MILIENIVNYDPERAELQAKTFENKFNSDSRVKKILAEKERRTEKHIGYIKLVLFSWLGFTLGIALLTRISSIPDENIVFAAMGLALALFVGGVGWVINWGNLINIDSRLEELKDTEFNNSLVTYYKLVKNSEHTMIYGKEQEDGTIELSIVFDTNAAENPDDQFVDCGYIYAKFDNSNTDGKVTFDVENNIVYYAKESC